MLLLIELTGPCDYKLHGVFDSSRIDMLPPGRYIIVEKIDTIVVSEKGKPKTQSQDATTQEISKRYNNLVQEIDYSKPANPVDNLKVGDIFWREGERYYSKSDGSECRFPAPNEPMVVDGKRFTGKVVNEKPVWSDGDTRTKQKEKKKKLLSDEDISDLNIDELIASETKTDKTKAKQEEKKKQDSAKTNSSEKREPEKVTNEKQDDDIDWSSFDLDLSTPSDEEEKEIWRDGSVVYINYNGNKLKKEMPSVKLAEELISLHASLGHAVFCQTASGKFFPA